MIAYESQATLVNVFISSEANNKKLQYKIECSTYTGDRNS